MKEKQLVDGLSYELRDKKCDSDGKIISAEVHAHASSRNSYSSSSERMMNRICQHQGSSLSPNYIPIAEDIGVDENNQQFVRNIIFKVQKNIE